MEISPLSSRHEFTRRAAWRGEEEARVLNHIRTQEQKAKKREDEREKANDELMERTLAALATEAQIEAFTVKIDTYDAATVEALMENDRALEKVREELRIMLDKAYVLPDGRRVFKTEDGSRVFDEHGQEVKEFDAGRIEEWRPTWEKFQKTNNEREALTQERRDLIDYQSRLDKTREETKRDDLTKGELDELEKRLEDNMPEAVRRRLKKDDDAPDHDRREEPKGASFHPAAKLDMPAL